MPLVILLPPKTRRVGEWCVIELPLQYESKESQSERGERSASGEEDYAKKQQ